MISRVSTGQTLSAQFQVQRNQQSLLDISRRLATGRKINAGRDNPAGLIAAERLAAETQRLAAESRAAERLDAHANIAEGKAAQLSGMFAELDALVVASANTAGMSDAEIQANQLQIDSLSAGIQRFAGESIEALDGVNLPDGGNGEVESLYDDAIVAAASVQSGGANDLASGNFEAAQTALRSASSGVATARGRIGAYQKDTLAPQMRSARITIENLVESRSRIVDADYAVETSNLARANVLLRASTSALRTAQQLSGSVLDLLS